MADPDDKLQVGITLAKHEKPTTTSDQIAECGRSSPRSGGVVAESAPGKPKMLRRLGYGAPPHSAESKLNLH